MSVQKIIIKIKQVYGKETIYPVCSTAILLAQLAGKITLSRSDLALIKNLGYEIEIEAQKL